MKPQNDLMVDISGVLCDSPPDCAAHSVILPQIEHYPQIVRCIIWGCPVLCIFKQKFAPDCAFRNTLLPQIVHYPHIHGAQSGAAPVKAVKSNRMGRIIELLTFAVLALAFGAPDKILLVVVSADAGCLRVGARATGFSAVVVVVVLPLHH